MRTVANTFYKKDITPEDFRIELWLPIISLNEEFRLECIAGTSGCQK